MNLAYIISAYKNPTQLIHLVRQLNTRTSSFFIHIDKRSDQEIFDEVVQAFDDWPNVHFLNRHRCYWGGFGHVQATLKGISEIFRIQTAFDYAILLTGQDYPIKTNDHIQAFFQQHNGKSFIEFFPLPTDQWKSNGMDRIESWHFHYKNGYFAFPEQLNARIKRRFPGGFQPFGGSGYWCLTRECIELIDDFIHRNPSLLTFSIMFTFLMKSFSRPSC